MDIASIFVQAAERYPKSTALVYEDRRWTYREWYARVHRFAQGLVDLGVRPSDRVAFYVTTSENPSRRISLARSSVRSPCRSTIGSPPARRR